MPKISFETLQQTIQAAFQNAGMNPDDAATCARIHAETTLDGVHSHGLNRVARIIGFIQRGFMRLNVRPTLHKRVGSSLEVYEGHRGVGVLNALFCTERGMALAAQQGMALIALRNTSHWMRGGTYGWLAAEHGYIAIAWTNTDSCLPAWGASDNRLGNNPFVMAAPRPSGPMVLDMAMSQYSFGKLETTRLKGERLPTIGGWDTDGRMTDDPGAIEQSRRLLPTGLWKGSGMAILLDVLAAVLSEGLPTAQVDIVSDGSYSCAGCSQIFLILDPRQIGGEALTQQIVDAVATQVHASTPIDPRDPVEFPGQGTLRRRAEQSQNGIQVDDTMWAEVLALANPA